MRLFGVAAFTGDPPAIAAARRELKNAFSANRHLTDRREINEKLAEAVEANEFVRHNVVQAVKKDCGAYEISPEKAQQLRELPPDQRRPPARS
ncbi:hypothetical protein GPECTOR_83g283 [Gonium pectorale]|uniref:Uncharacterized protein n=1 Tax=Gonium pectorale TaxID=33097 RepID=A0A150G1I4_GONPE|nr:hypothetical protein GPECTOR_83g283 [Gonium pectorale]|eukprot:KXZ43671.1 hypothetical protein GPECTOR_83g283 [Gonium pectorale]